MNKVVITEFGDESKLAAIEADLPDPAAGEVQLSVEYSIVSGPGVNMRRDAYPFQRNAHSHRVTTSSARSASRITAAQNSKSANRVAVSFFGLRRSSKNFMPDLELLFEWLRSGKISVPVKATFRLEEIQMAHWEYAAVCAWAPLRSRLVDNGITMGSDPSLPVAC